MIRALFALAILFPGAAAAQQADSGEARLLALMDQAAEAGPVTILLQDGQANAATIEQQGIANAVLAAQGGDNNSLSLRQDGANNRAALVQQGDNNAMSAVQTGNNNSLQWVQAGDNLADLAITQTGGQNIQITQTR